MKNLFLSILFCISTTAFSSSKEAQLDSASNSTLSEWAYELLNIPKLKANNRKEIVVAVIDDAFLLSHKGIKDFIYTNADEIPNNNIDDDKDGYIDNYTGWDVSDNDADVTLPKGFEEAYYHGTFIASTIAKVAQYAFGDKAPQVVKILPVKCLSDNTTKTAIVDGYKGIQYATLMGADIICCAWSGGITSVENHEIVQEALRRGILLLAAAGNEQSKTAGIPSSITGVYSISAFDSTYKKLDKANYHAKVDLSLPGENVKASYPIANNAWFYSHGTSAATGLAVGCASVLMAYSEDVNYAEVMNALKSTAVPIEEHNPAYCGRLGAGYPNLTEALQYLSSSEGKNTHNSKRPEGSFIISKKFKKKDWEVSPNGTYQAIRFTPEVRSKKDFKKIIQIANHDSVVYEGDLETIAGGIEIEGSEAWVIYPSLEKLPKSIKMNYEVLPLDSTILFCSGTKEINTLYGVISDGSDKENYANNCACKWQITVSENKRVHLSFKEFSTEAKVDFVWLFDGTIPHQDAIIAKFSGNKIPPVIISRTNKVLVWFVTDNLNTEEGWVLEFEER